MQEAVATFGAELQSVSQARRFVRETLEAWNLGHLASEASLCVTELATNSVIHARTRFDINLRHDDLQLRLAVRDGSTRQPITKARTVQATTGRGLRVIEAMANSWGVTPDAEGKTVWCDWHIKGLAGAHPGSQIEAEPSVGVVARGPDLAFDSASLADGGSQLLSERAA